MLPQISDYLIYVICYVIGSIPSGYIIGLIIANQDVRNQGSGNIGATNLARIYGKRAGIATFIADCLKTIIALRLVSISGESLYIAAFLVTLGHIYPIWLGFRGGKGVATLVTSLYYLNPYIGLIFTLIWLGVFVISKTSSLASIISIVAICVISCFFYLTNHFTYYLLATSILVLFNHRDNMLKLVRGDELKFKVKNEKK